MVVDNVKVDKVEVVIYVVLFKVSFRDVDNKASLETINDPNF